MGMHTTYLGLVTIAPALSVADVDLVRSFSARHGYDVTPPAPGAPAGRSPWTVCDDGCCLFWDGLEKPYAGAPWLTFLIELVDPGHSFDGALVAWRHERQRLTVLRVSSGAITEEVLLPGVSELVACGWQPEDEARAERGAQLARRRERYALAVARDLAAREDERHDGPAA